MRNRIGAALVAVAAGLIILAAGTGPAPAQDAAKAPPPKFLYGHDLRVRPGGEKDFPKARKVGVEVFQDQATGANIGITEDGAIAVAPAGPVAAKKDCQWLTGLDMSVRKAGEPEFTQKTRKFGVEVFHDLGSNRLLYACQTGSIAFAPVPANLGKDKGPRWHHGLEPKVRQPDQDRFDDAKRFGLEVYKDENTGGLVYVTETGSIAAAAAPAAAPDKNKVAPPRPAYGLILRVRKSDEPDFTDKTRRLGVEVFEDPNANTLMYMTEPGFLAVVPNPGKLDAEAKGVTWKGAMALAARKAGETDFSKAKKYGIEVFQDNKTGNLIFVCETGSIAVLAK